MFQLRVWGWYQLAALSLRRGGRWSSPTPGIAEICPGSNCLRILNGGRVPVRVPVTVTNPGELSLGHGGSLPMEKLILSLPASVPGVLALEQAA